MVFLSDHAAVRAALSLTGSQLMQNRMQNGGCCPCFLGGLTKEYLSDIFLETKRKAMTKTESEAYFTENREKV